MEKARTKTAHLSRILTVLTRLACLFYGLTINAREPQQGLAYWTDLTLTGKLIPSSHWLYWFEVQNRYHMTAGKTQITLLRSALGVAYSDSLSLWCGYQWNSINGLTEGKQQEIFWQQAIWRALNRPHLSLTLRSRFEFRHPVDRHDWAYRLREQLTLKLPNDRCPFITPVIYDEIFFNLNHPIWVNQGLLSQNRLFMGIDIPLSKSVTLETGYMQQYQASRHDKFLNHVLMTTLNINTD